jgi:hypothetical protein
MNRSCPSGFDDTLLSGYLDHELTQAEEQKTRVHLEDCEHCGGLFEDLKELRGTAMSTHFTMPDDEQWNESPKGGASLLTRGLGWLVAILWAVAVSGYGLYHLWTGTEDLVEKLLVFGGIAAAALLFLSVLLDRLRVLKTDRYREVDK